MAPFTYEIAAKRYLNEGALQARVAWAQQMTRAGFDSPGLRQLAAATRPFERAGQDALFDQCARELGLPRIEDERQALALWATALVRRYVDGDAATRWLSLAELARLWVAYDAFDDIQPFYVLYYANVDLSTSGAQGFLAEATADNIDQLIMDRCNRWRAEHGTGVWDRFDWAALAARPAHEGGGAADAGNAARKRA